MNLPPSTFTGFPWESVLGNSEAETVACNIMKIRKRLGDRWEITWSDYAAARKADGGFPNAEHGLFDEVIPLISDQIGAISFSRSWADAAMEASKP